MSTPQMPAVPPERLIGCGLAIGDLQGFGRVDAEGSLISLAFDRVGGTVRASQPERPLLSLHVDGEVTWVGAYVPGTNVLESTARTEAGELRVVDFMALAEGRPGQGEALARGRFVRIVTCTEGELTLRMVCAARASGEPATQASTIDGWHLACSRPLVFGDAAATASLRLVAGESVAFMLGKDAIEGGAALVADALHGLGDTIHYWTWWSDRCRYKGDDFDAVLREALALKLACPGSGLMVEQRGDAGFAVASLGDMSRAASRFLELGYRQECADLLSCVYAHGPSSTLGRWAYDDAFVETLDRYVARYGMAQLPGALRAAVDVPAQSLAS
ncbi:MAG: hypothetical protein ABWX83_08750 [Luteibacter sp.]